VQRAPGVPHALWAENSSNACGRIASRGRKRVFRCHCERSEAIHVATYKEGMDCFASLAMTNEVARMHSRRTPVCRLRVDKVSATPPHMDAETSPRSVATHLRGALNMCRGAWLMRRGWRWTSRCRRCAWPAASRLPAKAFVQPAGPSCRSSPSLIAPGSAFPLFTIPVPAVVDKGDRRSAGLCARPRRGAL
jgi:hypothetical protein